MNIIDSNGEEIEIVMHVTTGVMEERTSLDEDCAICKAPVSGMDLCQECHDRVQAVIAKDLARQNIKATVALHEERQSGASWDQERDSDGTGFK